MIAPGDIAPRRDLATDVYVVVISNDVHISAETGRIITCPFIPGEIPEDQMSMTVSVSRPAGIILPELVQWLPANALDAPIGNVGSDALYRTSETVSRLLAHPR